jgi:hypothetical protein
MSILRGDTHETDHAQLKGDREKLSNIREFRSKVQDGTRFPFGNWEAHTCVDTRMRECIERPKRENKYKGGRQAMVPASACEVVIHKVHTHDGHYWQERTWKDIVGAYHSISRDLMKTYVKICSCTSVRDDRTAKRKRGGTATWAPSA